MQSNKQRTHMWLKDEFCYVNGFASTYNPPWSPTCLVQLLGGGIYQASDLMKLGYDVKPPKVSRPAEWKYGR